MATMPNVTAIRPVPQSRRQIVSAQSSGIPQAIGQFANAVGQVVDAQEKERDAQAVFAARRQLDEWERKALFDPKDGAVNKRGADAFDVPQRLTQDFDRVAGEVSQGLGSERQRQAFRDVLESRRGQITSWADRHAQKERESYDRGEYESDIKTMTDRAAMFPDKASPEIDQIERRTIGYLRSKGRSEAEINAALADQRDKAHASVIASMLSSENDTEAAAYFEANKDRMSQGMRDRVAGEVRERSTLLSAQRNADELIAAGVSEKDALAQTRAKFQGKGEEVAAQQIRTRFAEAEAARLDRVKQVSTSAWSVLMDKGSMSAIPPTIMAELRSTAPEEERQMRDWLQSKADQARARAKGTFEPDDQLYIGFRQMARDEPQKFLALDLKRYAPKFSDAQTNTLLSMQDGITRKDDREAESNRVTTETIRAMDGQIRAIGIDTTPKEGSKQAVEYAKFKASVFDALDQTNAIRKAKGQPPLSDAEARSVVAPLLREGIEQGSGIFGFGGNKQRGYQIASDPANAGRVFIAKRYGDIPADARAELVKKVQTAEGGKGPRGSLSSEQEALVERMYQAGIESGRYK